MRWLVFLVFASCTCVRVPNELAFACEADGGCETAGFRCDVDRQLCVQVVDAGCTRTTCAALNAECGNVSDGCGGTLSCGTCTSGRACGAGTLPNRCDTCSASAVDLPDDELRDTNCDGIDGDANKAVFVDAVGGVDTAAGTRTAPVRTIAAALGIASTARPQVLLAEGTYTGDVVVGPAASLYGGYTAGTWERESGQHAIILGAVSAQARGAAQPLTLDALDVTSPTPATPGAASVALTLVGVQGRLVNCSFTASGGADGAPGLGGLDGGAGQDGQPGSCGADSLTLVGAGGAGCGGDTSANGGVGGRGGDPNVTGGNDTAGASGQPSPLGGDGGVPCATTPNCAEQNGRDGQAGAAGAVGIAGMAGDGIGAVAGGTWTAARGTNGNAGRVGKGGGGGGGGAALLDGVTHGCSGGGAGSGSCGGGGGLGGQGGGASIALLLEDSSPQLRAVKLSTVGGGRGGEGGRSGQGGAPGAGAGGPPSVPALVGGASGVGGAGGRGGAGGAGGSGGGGPSIGIWCVRSNPTFDGSPMELLGPGGLGAGSALAGERLSQVGCPP